MLSYYCVLQVAEFALLTPTAGVLAHAQEPLSPMKLWSPRWNIPTSNGVSAAAAAAAAASHGHSHSTHSSSVANTGYLAAGWRLDSAAAAAAAANAAAEVAYGQLDADGASSSSSRFFAAEHDDGASNSSYGSRDQQQQQQQQQQQYHQQQQQQQRRALPHRRMSDIGSMTAGVSQIDVDFPGSYGRQQQPQQLSQATRHSFTLDGSSNYAQHSFLSNNSSSGGLHITDHDYSMLSGSANVNSPRSIFQTILMDKRGAGASASSNSHLYYDDSFGNSHSSSSGAAGHYSAAPSHFDAYHRQSLQHEAEQVRATAVCIHHTPYMCTLGRTSAYVLCSSVTGSYDYQC
jgi:hypothetical protein